MMIVTFVAYLNATLKLCIDRYLCYKTLYCHIKILKKSLIVITGLKVCIYRRQMRQVTNGLKPFNSSTLSVASENATKCDRF